MSRLSWLVRPALALAAVLVLSVALQAHPPVRVVVPSPVVRYYTPATVYYSAPVVTYYSPAPVYYTAPPVVSTPFYSYYMSPGYIAPATTYYHYYPLVRPRVIFSGTTTYYTPLYFRY